MCIMLVSHPLGHCDDPEREAIDIPHRALLSGAGATVQHRQTLSAARGRADSRSKTHTRTHTQRTSVLKPDRIERVHFCLVWV